MFIFGRRPQNVSASTGWRDASRDFASSLRHSPYTDAYSALSSVIARPLSSTPLAAGPGGEAANDVPTCSTATVAINNAWIEDDDMAPLLWMRFLSH